MFFFYILFNPFKTLHLLGVFNIKKDHLAQFILLMLLLPKKEKDSTRIFKFYRKNVKTRKHKSV